MSAPELVVCSLEPWDDVWRRNQFLVRELLARDTRLRVLFVEPPVSLPHELRHWRLPRGAGLRAISGRPRLWALQPVRTLPRRLGTVADWDLCLQVRRAASRLRFCRPVLWVNDSLYAPLVQPGGWPSLYDITDDWLLAEAPAAEKRRRQHQDRRLLARADAVVVCSPALANSRGGSRTVSLIPNAVDSDHYRRPQPRPDDLPTGPTAVYVGTLHDERVDLTLLEAVASHGGAAVVLVGPDCLSPGARARIHGLPNVHLLGPRPYERIPAYWQHADVVIVPHVVSPFTETLDPIKAYECLAAGRPTLATPVAGFRELGGNVRCVPADSFAVELKEWLESPPPWRPGPEPPSWTSRAEEFGALISQIQPSVQECSDASRRLRVAYVDHCAQLSGAELALARLLTALPDVDARVALAENGPLVAKLRACGAIVEVLPLADRIRTLPRGRVGWRALDPMRVWKSAAYVLRLSRWIRRVAPDAVHTNSLKAHLYGGVAARLAGFPLVWHLQDRIASDYLPASVVRFVRIAAGFLPDAIVANSQTTLASLGPRLRWRANQPRVVIGCPVLPGRPLVEHGGFRICMVGRLARWKGQHVFLEALAQAFPASDEDDDEWQGVIVGAALFDEAGYEEELRQLAAELGLESHVQFLGFREEVDDELANMDVLVHASVIAEPFGQVVTEGMAAGLAVVAPALGGPAEVIEDGVTGLLYPPGDSVALARIMRTLRTRPDLRTTLGGAARERTAAFAPDVIAPQMVEIYHAVRRSRRSGRAER